MITQRPLSLRNRILTISTRSLPLAVLALLFALSSLPVAAQSGTATLSGTVEDENGAVIPGAAITVLNPSTALQRQATTNDQGSFTVTLLQPGTYSVTVRRDGFAPIEVKNVVLNVGDQKALRIELKAGDVNAEVQITGEAPLINESPAIATTIDKQFVGNLPLNGRSFQSLILLTPGVVVTPAGGQPNSGQFSVNGQRNNANYFTVDGVGANIGVGTSGGSIDSKQAAGSVPGFTALGTTANLVSIDALEEFKIQTSTYTAELGRQPGGQVQLITRSGGNQVHWTAFDYLRNEAFDARDWFNKTPAAKPPIRQNQFGGTFSGPVFLPRFGEGGSPFWSGKDSTFFFFSYEGQRLVLPRTANFMVPSMRLRDVAASGFKPLLNMFPLPTGPETTTSTGAPSGLAPFVGSYSSPSRLDSTSVRTDHRINSKLTVFGRYNEAPSSNPRRTLSLLIGNFFNSRTLTLGATVIPSTNVSNELRVNYSSNRGRFRFTMDNFGGAIPIDPSVLISGYSGVGTKLGRFQFFLPGSSFLSPALGDAVDNYQRQINIVDNMSWVKGAHTFKFGIDYRRLAPIYGPAAYSETIAVNSQAQVTSGIAQFVNIDASQETRPVFDNFSVYGQTTWKLSQRLALDLGLRWELNPAPYDANGLKPVLVCGVENLPSATLCPPNTSFYKTSHTAFAPRLGVAYLLDSKSGKETVLRGGFGIYYDLGSGQSARSFSGYPFTASASLPNVAFPLMSSQAVPPSFSPVTLPISSTLFALNKELKLPYTTQWSLSLQRSLGQQQAVTLSYVASAGRRLLTTEILNLGPPLVAAQPNPNFGTINYTHNGPASDYQSLQAQYQRRLLHGLQTVVNYTWSHAIDEASDELNNGVFSRANADFDVRQNLTAAVTYDFPKISAGPILNSIMRDWSVDFTLYAQSGPPLPVTAGVMAIPNTGALVSVRPDAVLGVPFWIKDSNAPGGRRLNLAAFARPPRSTVFPLFYARQGTLGRNVVRAPGIFQLNMALGRRFNFTERLKLQLKAEAFNLFNRPHFSSFNNSMGFGPADFGLATSTLANSLGGLNSLYQLGGQRSMQFSVRLSY